jgi:hypothetical protein
MQAEDRLTLICSLDSTDMAALLATIAGYSPEAFDKAVAIRQEGRRK